jgi:3-hydroxymyristoyl/3-hydroxydecanoyl-(acyl carrier protein) dehydratase
MDGHFRAFSFVDRITSLERGVSIRGRYTVPSEVAAFPISLVAEAVGQLAAWAAMAAVNFAHRPVAGIAGKIELLSNVRPGQVLDLAAELESVDDEMVGYSGRAQTNGAAVIRLGDCVGPMVPLEDFDEPQALRERLSLLQTVGAGPGGFGGLPAFALEHQEGEPGHLARAILHVPEEAPFFADHFPRRPVFPGTLLMHANLQTAALLASELCSGEDAGWLPRVVSSVKLRSFISPGETLQLEAKLTGRSEASMNVVVESRNGPRLIGSADVQLSRGVNL